MLRTIIPFWSMVVLATGALTGTASAQLIFPPPVAAPRPAPPRPTAPRPAPRPSGPSALEIERAAYNSCANARTAGPCQQYLAKYPNGGYAELARGRLNDTEAAERSLREAAERSQAVPAPVPTSAPGGNRETADAERLAWAACDASTSPEACNLYITRFRRGSSVKQARAKIEAMNAATQDRAAWALCQSSSIAAPCQAYVKQFPNGSQVVMARDRIATLLAGAQERNAWAQCMNNTFAAACTTYVAAYPEGAMVALARQRIASGAAIERDNTAWRLCQNGGIDDCRGYIATFPSGSQVAAARARMGTLAKADRERAAAAAIVERERAAAALIAERQRAAAQAAAERERAALALCQSGDTVRACEIYLAAYPAGAAASDVRARIAQINLAEQEKIAWAQCENGKQVLPCARYLAAFPAGRFAEPVRTRIKMLETAETEPEMVPALGIIVKRSDRGEFVVVSVQQFSSAMGNIFGGDVIIKINDAPINPRSLPRAALESGLAASSGRVKLLVRRGPATVTAVIRAKQ